MANASRNTTGNLRRLLQYGVDTIAKQVEHEYDGKGDKLFKSVSTDGKGFYEIVQLAGMGLATIKGEGDDITTDSVDQDWDARFPVTVYQKAGRISMEAIEYNVYEDPMKMIAHECMKANKYNRDYQQANVLNLSTVTNGPDGVPLLSTAHPLQAGGTNSNRLSPDLDLSEDAVEAAVILIDNFYNPDGLQSMYESKQLIVPVGLKYVAERICGSKYRTATTDNDIQALNNRGDIEGYTMWKRLTSQSTWYVTTDAENGLLTAEKKGFTTKISEDPFTFDTIISIHTIFKALFANYRCIAGSVGP